jgi:hypothetical protein
VPGWTGYLDLGLPTVLRVHLSQAQKKTLLPVLVSLVGAACTAVFTVPKTVPAVTLGTALGQQLSDDGSQDILVIHEPGPATVWPTLFVDALALVDPASAAQLHANDLTRQS